MKKFVGIVTIALILCAIGFGQGPAFAESEIFVESEYEVDSSDKYFTLDFREGIEVKKVTSSNASVVSVEELYGGFVYLLVENVGTTVITATDTSGATDTCKVTVLPDPLVLDNEEDIELTDYNDVDEFEILSETNQIKSVVSSDKNVVKVVLDEMRLFTIIPVSAGTATITVTDIYQKTKTFNVMITQKFIDEMKYLEDISEAFEDVCYGDKEIYFYTGVKNAEVLVELDGVTYTGVKGYEYGYVVKNIPPLPVGTLVGYTIKKGEAVYTSSARILRGDLCDNAYVELGKYDSRSYVYNGKKQVPSVRVEYFYRGCEDEPTKLKENVDYIVEYSDNLNVGKASVKIKGIGNYAYTTTDKFNILPKGTNITKASGMNDSFKLRWKKQATKMSKTRINGYQIRYSIKSSMSGAKKIKVKECSKTSANVKRLESNKKYYVQVRTYKVVKGKTYYSKWSKKKTVKTR